MSIVARDATEQETQHTETAAEAADFSKAHSLSCVLMRLAETKRYIQYDGILGRAHPLVRSLQPSTVGLLDRASDHASD